MNNKSYKSCSESMINEPASFEVYINVFCVNYYYSYLYRFAIFLIKKKKRSRARQTRIISDFTAQIKIKYKCLEASLNQVDAKNLALFIIISKFSKTYCYCTKLQLLAISTTEWFRRMLNFVQISIDTIFLIKTFLQHYES